jgi:hypothetical protein
MNMPNMHLTVLQCGSCETLKMSVHATALGLSALMGAYNAAAWLSRRDKHLAVNAVLYALLAAWEQKHVAHHMRAMRRCRQAASIAEPSAPQPLLTQIAA